MYYKLLGLSQEPFSTSPDPQFFYYSQSHKTALKRLEIQIRLRRGMSVIFGDVGTGKTTLSRILLQEFAQDKDHEFYIMMDPSFSTEHEFMSHLAQMFGLKIQESSLYYLKSSIESFLFDKGVKENKVVVLMIDEGQKLSLENLEILRTMLNFETNEYKLLQLVIFSQLELLPEIAKVHNLMDRIALKYVINTLDLKETQRLIKFRLEIAGYNGNKDLFSDDAIKAIQDYAQGYPRKIALLCHEALERALMSEQTSVDKGLIDELIKERDQFEVYISN